MNTLTLLATAVVVIGLSPIKVFAGVDEVSRPVANWTPIDPARLADMRGGMQLPSGLSLSFGIERLVYVNGELVANASLQISDVSRMTTEQAQALAAINAGMVVRTGQGNHFDAGGGAAALVIQNSLDGQQIVAITTLDISVDTLASYMQANTFDALHSTLINAPGSP
jgi:hypothetical protein